MDAPEQDHPTPDPTPRGADRRGTGRALVAGALAAGLGVAVAELVGSVVRSAGPPVAAVGDEVIDRAPSAVTKAAIEMFGTNDKPALVLGTLVLLLASGAALGVVARRHPGAAVAVAGAIAAIGVAATHHQQQTSWVLAAVPTLAGLLAAVVALGALRPLTVAPRRDRDRAPDPAPAPADADPDPAPRAPAAPAADELPPRRRFLVAAGATAVLTAGVAVAGRLRGGATRAAASRAALRLPSPVDPLPPLSAGVAPDPTGVAPFTTPNRAFYRIDTALRIPDLPVEGYRLRVHGMVDQELDLSWDDLVGRDLHEYDITLTCVSNQIGDTLVGNARWLGFPLRDLLDEAGVDPAADQIVGRSQDGYTGGFPVAAARDRDAIVAVGMNGEPLPLAHGFPVRLVTPGLYGYLSATKWLTEIELTTFDAFDSYWVPRGYAERAPIKTMSRIDTPRNLARVEPGPRTVGGVAWAQTRGIERVEVRIDDGPWQRARLSDELNLDTWRQWTLPWDATPGSHTIVVRATDATGEVQTEERVAPLPDGATGWHTVRVRVAG